MENRWEIIQYLIDKYNYKTYCEVGAYKFWNFDKIECDVKIAVDPNPCKTPEQESWQYGSGNVTTLDGKLNYFPYEDRGSLICKLTSDDYFLHCVDSFDIFFIDGLHEHNQVYRDIQNSLKHLNKGGVILLHDMLPPSLEHVTTGDKNGNWNGDCYKALLQFIQDDPLGYYSVFTIDTDWGIGLIKPHQGDLQPFERNYSVDYYKALNDWDYFDKNRNELLNVISIEQFKKMF